METNNRQIYESTKRSDAEKIVFKLRVVILISLKSFKIV